jgi:AbrB family looped-hinge helix DNA binding protein
MAEVTISARNQIVVPLEAREALNLKPGDKLLVVVHDNQMLVLEKPRSARKALKGLGRGLYPKDYLKKERDSW